MNRRVFSATVAIALAMVFSAAPAAAQSLSGSWELSTEGGRRGPMTSMLTLVHDGASLTGTLTMTMGGRGGGGGGAGAAREIEITDGKVEGNNFSFTMTLEFNGNSMSQVYSGTFEGDTMSGQVEGGRGGGRPFTGKRSS